MANPQSPAKTATPAANTTPVIQKFTRPTINIPLLTDPAKFCDSHRPSHVSFDDTVASLNMIDRESTPLQGSTTHWLCRQWHIITPNLTPSPITAPIVSCVTMQHQSSALFRQSGNCPHLNIGNCTN